MMRQMARMALNPYVNAVVRGLTFGAVDLSKIVEQTIISWVKLRRRHAASFVLALFQEHGIPMQTTKRMIRRLDDDIEQSQFEYYLNRWAAQQLRYRV